MKNDKLKDRDRKKDVEALLGPMAEERFALLVNLGKKISDFNAKPGSGAAAEDSIDDSMGINVQFEESEEEDDENPLGEINEEDEDEDREGEETKGNQAIHAANVI